MQANNTLRILFVDDDSVTCSVMQRNCDRVGYSCAVFQSPKECLADFEKNGADLLVTDLRMPEMSGLEATAAIREWQRQTAGRHVPIVAMTAHAMKGDDQQCFDAGMDGYVAKPVNSQELLRTIHDVLQKA